MAQVLSNPQLMQQAGASPDLNDFTYFNNRSYGGIGEEEVNSDRGRNALAAIQKYDPSAKYNPTYTSDGNLMGYQLQFDPSKLPGAGDGGQLGGSNPSNGGGSSYAGGSGYMPQFSTVQEHMNLLNPNAVAQSNHYGKITSNANIYDKPDLMGQLAPAAILALGTFLSGGALSPAMGAILKAPQTLAGMNGTGGFNPFSIAGMSLPFIPGVSPFMSTVGRIGLNAIGSQQRGG